MKATRLGRVLCALLFFYAPSVYAHALDQEWLALLRYNRYGDNFQSEADDPHFFLSANGKTNPQDEYHALQKALSSPVNDDHHPACIFPARSLKLLRDGAVKNLDFNNCAKLQQYLRAMPAKGASLIFAGYFIQRPSSAFGHTFLRLHTNQQGNAALLDNAVDFAASVDTNNPLLYGVKGILGGFPGRFSRMPYFLKLREYADLESRDLWEYPLDLSQEQVNNLVLHLWEMDQTYFSYFYFSENCSYHILRAIEAISGKPASSHLKFFVTPLDTIFALHDAGLLLPPKRRPSQHAVLTASLKRLNNSERTSAYQFLEDPLSYKGELPKSANALDAFIEILNYRFAEELLTDRPRPAVAKLRQKLLVTRSSHSDFEPLIIDTAEQPAAGHRGSWLSLGYSYRNHGSTILEHAFALHKIEHPSLGFSNRFQMIMGRAQVRLSDSEFSLERFDIFDVVSASDSFSWEFKPSWRMAFGLERSLYDSNFDLRAYSLLRSGISFGFNPGMLISLSFDFKPRHNPYRREKANLPLGPSVYFQQQFNRWRIGSEASWYREIFAKQNEYTLDTFVRYQASEKLDLSVTSKSVRGKTVFDAAATFFY